MTKCVSVPLSPLPRSSRILILGVTIIANSLIARTQAADRQQVLPSITHTDSLLPNSAHPAGKPLDEANLSDGGGKWVATKDVIIGENGATAKVPAVAHINFPMIAGIIRVGAGVSAKGSGFTGLALGRANLSNDFWKNLAVLLTVSGDGQYNLFSANKNLIGAPDKTLIHPDDSNHLELILNTTTRAVTIRINGKTALGETPLPKEAQLEEITAAGFRFQEPITGQPVVSNFSVETTSMSATGFEPLNLEMCFVAPNENATLRWRVASPGPAKQIPYFIKDYCGNKIDSGSAAQGDDGIVSLSRIFPRGYGEITFPEANQTFGIVALEPQVGAPDPFFCIDAGLSWLELNPDRRAALVKIAARCGIAMARERLGLGAINPEKEKFNWEGGRLFDGVRKMYAESKVPILEILDGGAKYLGSPMNLPEMSAALSEVARHWPIWGGAEVCNEQDLKGIPADQYVPMVKSMSYALSEAQSKAPIVTGVFATMPPGPYFDTCQANGMLEDSNVVSFHSYDRAPDVESMVARYRIWLKNSGKEEMMLWHTECGWSWTRGPSRPPQDQDAISALEISAKAVETMACGVARYFPFVYVYYEEGNKNFGMMGREATPLRSMAAYAMCIRALSGKEYLGDIPAGTAGLDASVKIARVFGNALGSGTAANECVAVLYTGRLDAQAKISFPIKIKRAAGADGRNIALSDQGLPIPDGMAYAWMALSDVQAKLKTDTFAKRLYELGQHPLIQQRRASPLVLQFLAEQTPSRASARRYLVTQETAHEFPLNVRVHNLSQAPILFTPEVSLPGTVERLPGTVERLPSKAGESAAPVTVPAMGYSDIAWKLDVTPYLDIAQTRFIFVSGKFENGIQPLPLAIPVVIEGSMEQHLKKHKKQLPLRIAALTNWKSIIALNGKSKFSITRVAGAGVDGVWRMDVKFSGAAGNWAYPKFKLPEKIDPEAYSGFLIRARILQAASGVAIIAGSSGETPSFWVSDLFPADGEWHVVYVPFAEFKPGPGGAGNQNTRLDPAAWRDIGIGMGSKGADNALEISQFILVGGSGD